jgi:glycosyltransferase involved in cell wall biosynthesis
LALGLAVEAGLKTILYLHCGAELYGADYVLLNLIRHLDPQRFRAIVILPYDGPLVVELKKLQVTCLLHALPVLRRSCLSPLGLLRFVWQMLTTVVFVSRLCGRERVDLIHTNTAAIWAGGWVAALRRLPHIWQIMELVEKPRLVARLMNAMVALFSTRVFCISNAVREHFVRNWPQCSAKFETLYHGVDLRVYDPVTVSGQGVRAQLHATPETVVVLYASRFSAWKGQDVLAEAARLALGESQPSPPLRFVFLGSCYRGQEQYETELRALLQTVPDATRTASVHGFQQNLPEWLAAADMLILPSKLPEPNATVVIAAMAMRLPVIGTAIGGTVETVVHGQTGLLIPPDNARALADAVLELAADRNRRESMGRAGRARAEEIFSLEKYCQRVMAAYEA